MDFGGEGIYRLSASFSSLSYEVCMFWFAGESILVAGKENGLGDGIGFASFF